MEANTCNVNYLDADALLPPRKRLLAGLKKQNSDVNRPVPLPSTPDGAGSENDGHNNIYRSQLSTPSLSNEEIAEASRIAAIEAAKVAKYARANAEEKAARAARAVAAAKTALELVATLSEEATNKENFLKKSKTKKHVNVEALYNRSKGNSNCRTDEELARKLHQAINSSPRISKNSSGSDSKNHKHKRLKNSAFSGKTSLCNGALLGEGNLTSTTTSNVNGVVEEVGNEGPVKKIDMIMVDLNASKHDQSDQLKLDNGKEGEPGKTDRPNLGNSSAGALPPKVKFAESLDSCGKKRGRIKQKKLPFEHL